MAWISVFNRLTRSFMSCSRNSSAWSAEAEISTSPRCSVALTCSSDESSGPRAPPSVECSRHASLLENHSLSRSPHLRHRSFSPSQATFPRSTPQQTRTPPFAERDHRPPRCILSCKVVWGLLVRVSAGKDLQGFQGEMKGTRSASEECLFHSECLY